MAALNDAHTRLESLKGRRVLDMQLPDIPPKRQCAMINDHEMLRAEDIAVGVHYVLTQPWRTVIQRLDITLRLMVDE